MLGPHVQAYAEDILALPFADHAIMGEYERPERKRQPGGADDDNIRPVIRTEDSPQGNKHKDAEN